MTTLVTGGAGFLGSRLIAALLEAPDGLSPRRIVSADMQPCPISDSRVDSRVGTIADAAHVRSLLSEEVTCVFHLAAVLSGEAEADFARGMLVNVEGTRHLLEASHQCRVAPRFVFASTVAVFGGELPAVVSDDMALRPQSSYGTEKAMAELLVHEYTRRGVVDGVVCRVATVAVRPGAPSSAVSSFVSGIIREPIDGLDSVCPVPLDTPIWISSPDVVTRNLVHAGRLPAASLEQSRTVNLPGVSVTPARLLDSLEQLAGADARARVRQAVDPPIARIVASWPAAFDMTYARRLGFEGDADANAIVRRFLAQRAATAPRRP